VDDEAKRVNGCGVTIALRDHAQANRHDAKGHLLLSDEPDRIRA